METHNKRLRIMLYQRRRGSSCRCGAVRYNSRTANVNFSSRYRPTFLDLTFLGKLIYPFRSIASRPETFVSNFHNDTRVNICVTAAAGLSCVTGLQIDTALVQLKEALQMRFPCSCQTETRAANIQPCKI